MMESIFSKLSSEVERGIEGRNESINIGHHKLGRYAAFRKRMFILMASSTGAGKSSLIDDMMLNACDEYLKHPGNLKPYFILFSQERAKHLRIAKWIIRKIFQTHGITIEMETLLGWYGRKMTKDEHDLFLTTEDYINQLLEEYIEIYEGSRSPNDFYRIVKGVAKAHGKYEKINEFQEVYIPNDENLLMIPINDHGNLTKTTKELPTKKQAIDKLSGYFQGFRDLEGMCPVWVAQIKRELSSLSRTKDNEYEPSLDDVKESGDVGDACDVGFTLFDPLKFKQSSKTGYKPEDFVDNDTGVKYFRSVMIHKSTYGADDVRIPMAFNGFCGQFSELKRRKDLTDAQYNQLKADVLSKNYFLTP